MRVRFILHFILREISAKKDYSLQIVLSIAIGVGAVVGINSYKSTLNDSIFTESKTLMGADILVESSEPLTEEKKKFLKSRLPIGSRSGEFISFSSMIYRKDVSETSLSTVKALTENYPFYGKILTEPTGAYELLKLDEILLDESLSKNLKVRRGQFVYLGKSRFRFVGSIRKEPAVSGNFLSLAPTAIIRYTALRKTGLEERGSRIRYNTMIQLPEEIDSKQFKDAEFPGFIKRDLTIFHNTEIGSGTQRFISNTFDYTGLLGLSSLFLGSICILIACRVRIKEKFNEIAVLKCLGADYKFYSTIFLGELLILSVTGTLIGNIAGYYLQFQIPNLTGSEFLVNVRPQFNLKSFSWGIVLGIIIPLVVGMEAIFRTRKLSPLYAIRNELEKENKSGLRPDLTQIISIISVYLLFFGVASYETSSFFKGGILSGILVLLPVILYIFYFILRKLSLILLRIKIFSKSFRLSLKILTQPQSGVSLSIIGLGSALAILMISLVFRNSLLLMGGAGNNTAKPNIFVLDIRSEQTERFREISNKYRVEREILVPVIGARLAGINYQPVKKEDTQKNALQRDWRATARTREYFLSYRDALYDTESVVSGKFWSGNDQGAEISIEHEFAKNLGVSVGDSLQFNVQGVEVSGIVTNTRIVNWSDFKPNFVVIFSPSALKDAPRYYISSFFLGEPGLRYEFQKEVVASYPNLTVIDIEKATKNFFGMLDKVSEIINLLTFFIFAASVLLMVTSVYSNRRQKSEESSLLKIIGADSGFIRKIYTIEGLLIGIFSYLISLIFCLAANYILSEYFMKIAYRIPVAQLMIVFICSVSGTVAIYLLSVSRIIGKSPLEQLKAI
ncbi:MAG: FtsX-like permease family protein [Leptospira sp.]|nr:FtsX-like permease family protein [Leptospira sp.]